MGWFYRLRGGTAAEGAAVNPVLRLREPAVEVDTGRMKIGDGATAWNDLPYVAGLQVIPAGGAPGQMLYKASEADFDLMWDDAPEGGTGTTGGVMLHPFLTMGA